MKLITVACGCVLALSVGEACKPNQDQAHDQADAEAPAERDAETSRMMVDPARLPVPSGCSARELRGGTYDQTSIDALQGVTRITGSLTIRGTVSDLSALSCLVAVDGHLIIQGTRLSSLDDIDNLRFVGGYFSVQGNAELESVDALVGLETVGAGFGLSDSPLVSRVALPALHTLPHFMYAGPRFPGSLYMANLPKLETVILTQLETTTGDITIANSSELGDQVLTLDFGALREVGGALKLEGLAQLASLAGFGSLERSDGPVTLTKLPVLATLQGLDRLNTVKGHVVIADNEALQDLDALSALKTIDRGLGIARNPLVTSIRLPALRAVGDFMYAGPPFPGSLYMSELANLTLIDLPALQSTSKDIILSATGSLSNEPLDLSVAALEVIGGGLQLQNVSNLDELTAFTEVKSLKGTLTVTENPCITDVDAAALSAQLDPTNEVIAGNGQACLLTE